MREHIFFLTDEGRYPFFFLYLVVLVFGIQNLIASTLKQAEPVSKPHSASRISHSGKIEALSVEDAPYDDGTGIMLSWKPLPREMRIIQYRIYRGISPDTLFLFGQVEVNPAASVNAPLMYFYDKGYQSFLSIDSPSKLKREKQQSANSPLYDKIPRDAKILNRLFPYFSILAIVDRANFYKRSVKVINADGTVSAGLRPTQFEQLAANPIPGKTYYYTVLAVNEKGTFLTPADTQSATPLDNPPDNTARLYSVFLSDRGEFQFEWTSPASSYDIAQWQFWLLPKAQLPAFDEWQKGYIDNGGAPAAWTAKAILLSERLNDYNNYLTVKTQNGKIVNPDGSSGVALPMNNLQDYVPVLGVMDYSGFFSYSLGAPLRTISSKELPSKPVFTVTDKPNDKGDTNTLSFGLPLCFVTQAAFANAARTKIRINYEISDNAAYRIEAISFRISAQDGTILDTITEHYPDKIINLRLTKGYNDINYLKLDMAFRFKGRREFTDYYVTQSLSFDKLSKRFVSSDIRYKNENLSRSYYQIFRKNMLEPGFAPAKKLSAISRNYDDIVPFETTLQRMVTGIDVKSGRLLLDPILSFALDEKSGMPISVNIYRDEQVKQVNKMQSELAALQEQLNANPALADSLQPLIMEKESYLQALSENPVYKAAMLIQNPGKWLSFILREQQKLKRSYSYQVMKTDNEGAYIFSDASKTYFPISNWFNLNFLPALIACLVFTVIVIVASIKARRGRNLYLRTIAGLQEIDNAVGRATEMGKPLLYVPGWSTIGEITTIASMLILNRVAKKAAEYDTRIMVPNSDYYVMPLAQEMVREAYYEAGRPDSYNQVDVFYISNDQFPYAAGVNGIMIRERCATCFYMGFFNAEALLMTETGNSIGSIQIAGTDAITQVPFFITTCDYTLIGEEFYAASAYLSKDAELVSMLKAQDYFKFLIVFFILLGAILSSAHFNWLTNAFPLE